MTCPLASAALLNTLRILAASLRAMFPSHSASTEKKVTPGFDERGTDTSEAEALYLSQALAARIPLSAILMISWNRCFHES